mgnify:CR=1 FL=1
MNKGQSILSIIMWATAVSLPLVSGAYIAVQTQFSDINTRVGLSDIKVAEVGQKSIDMDNRLIRIENKIDLILQKK